MTTETLPAKPEHLPFLQAICWELADIGQLTPDEMLNRYERGWSYRGVLGEIEGEEKHYLARLAEIHGSWLQGRV